MSQLRQLLRPVALYGVLLTASLAGAYLSWTAEAEDPGDDEVVILDVEQDDVQGITYASEALTVTISPRSDEAGAYLWVDTDRTVKEPPRPEAETKAVPEPPAAAADTDADAAAADTDADAETVPASGTDGAPPAEPDVEPEPDPEPEPATRREQESFKGGPSADKLLDALAPLRAKRALDGVTDEQLGELGLDAPGATLTIAHGGGESVFELGDTVFGGDSRYARDVESGRVYLLDARVLRPLASAHHSMVDRELFRLAQPDIEAIEVEWGGRTTVLEHRNRADEKAAYWAARGEPTEHPTADAWLKKVLRMRAREFLPEGEAPTGTQLVLAYTVRGEGAEPVRVELHRGEPAGGQEAWYGRSSHTRAWVEVYRSQASDAAADVGTLFGDASTAQDPDATDDE